MGTTRLKDVKIANASYSPDGICRLERIREAREASRASRAGVGNHGPRPGPTRCLLFAWPVTEDGVLHF